MVTKADGPFFLELAPDEVAPMFARLKGRRVVHVIYDTGAPSILREGLTAGQISLANLVMHYMASQCGVIDRSADQGGRWQLVSAFPDGDLCWRCHEQYPHAPERLFAHPQAECPLCLAACDPGIRLVPSPVTGQPTEVPCLYDAGENEVHRCA